MNKTAQKFTLQIDHIGSGGDGVGLQEGTTVFVPKTTPGDVAVVREASRTTEGIFARLVQVLEPGPDRIQAPCPVFDVCGGCALQHLSLAAYERWKIDKVQKTLSKAGVTFEHWEEPEFLPAATRRRVTFSALKTKSEFFFGYTEGRSHHILDIAHCPVLDPALDQKMQALRPFIAQSIPPGAAVDVMLQKIEHTFDLLITGEIMIKGKFSYDQHEAFAEIARLGIARIAYRTKEFAAPEIILAQNSVIKKFGVLNVEIPPAAFLQASDAGENILSAAVHTGAEDAKNIADLFCGAGTFTGVVLDKAQKIYAADFDAGAIHALKKAAQNFKTIQIEKRNLFKNPLTAQELSDFDCVIFDPPRAGAKEQSEHLAQSTVARIIAVSCNPATFARDARLLMAGGYRLKSLKLIDQFVFSAHCELIGIFEKS